MSLTSEQIEHIANLAKLELTAEELILYRQQLSSILDYVASLQELDTSQIAPTSSVLPLQSLLRPDDPQPGLPVELLLSSAPDIEKNQYRIPPVFEG
jgi:aspartyl-tRNA(Asn)/glutamyl-tRNA(Gln) amidotransferase subunit C